MSIEKFICDRRVKWRTACSSETSGSAAAPRGADARESPQRPRGRPAAGIGCRARRPGLLNSNISGSRNLQIGHASFPQLASRTARDGCMTSASARAYASMSASVLVSVAHTSSAWPEFRIALARDRARPRFRARRAPPAPAPPGGPGAAPPRETAARRRPLDTPAIRLERAHQIARCAARSPPRRASSRAAPSSAM